MQNRYVGDVGDFGKFGLLRWLTGMREDVASDGLGQLRLGVVWYRRLEEPSDGGLIGYLSRTSENQREFHECDPHLYRALKDLVFKDNRLIRAVQRRGIFPDNTLYYDKVLSYEDLGRTQSAKVERRSSWQSGAREAVEEAEIIFVDPDNGLTRTESRHSKNGTKYAYLNDLRCFASRGQSLVIYHHLPRSSHTKAIRLWSVRLQMEFPRARIWAFRHQYKGVHRVYFIVVQPEHKDRIEPRLESFRSSLWCTVIGFKTNTTHFALKLRPSV